jgi:hypothetical protein
MGKDRNQPCKQRHRLSACRAQESYQPSTPSHLFAPSFNASRTFLGLCHLHHNILKPQLSSQGQNSSNWNEGLCAGVFNKLSRHLHRFLWKQHIRRLKLEFQKAAILSVVGSGTSCHASQSSCLRCDDFFVAWDVAKRSQKGGGNLFDFS